MAPGGRRAELEEREECTECRKRRRKNAERGKIRPLFTTGQSSLLNSKASLVLLKRKYLFFFLTD